MKICGLKLTHDGAIALIDNGKLIFSIEIEKLKNNPRYTSIEDTQLVEEVLKENGYLVSEIDYFAVDGWGGYDADALAIQPRLEVYEKLNKLSVNARNDFFQIDIAQYHERTMTHNSLEEFKCEGLPIEGIKVDYSTFLHVTGHIMSAYCTSPYAKRGESSYVLIWDGGMYPRLYYVDAQAKKIDNLGPAFLLIGNIYTIFSQHFGPFKVKSGFAKDSLSIAGKVMAYIALGNVRRELLPIFEKIYEEHYDTPMGFANVFANEFSKQIAGKGYSDEDVLATFHVYLEEMLVGKLVKKVSRYQYPSKNICIAGGCALNIKWNSAIRNSGAFDEVYVPPFPNDSGSAIGVACAKMFHQTNNLYLDWNVYTGPKVIKNEPASNWTYRDCRLSELAQLLHESQEPVVMLNDRAELGPRALGNRSIIAAPTSNKMKDILNWVKDREKYRPVSPICLEEDAKYIFEPGIKDPFMLFDHDVKAEWLTKIPAICHLDGSARLQTVSPTDNPVISELLIAYKQLSGVPLLCNTSANYNGSGFFPDIRSVTEWGRVNFVWSDGILYERDTKLTFFE